MNGDLRRSLLFECTSELPGITGNATWNARERLEADEKITSHLGGTHPLLLYLGNFAEVD
jgi:hypothetical protein